MTQKRTGQLSQAERARLREIRTRHEGSESLHQWASCDAALKDSVIGELEETLRALEGGGDAELVNALRLARDVLDVTGVPGATGTDEQTQNDIRWLLKRFENEDR